MTLTIEDAARICHEVNRAYCESLGDFSLLPWEATPQNIKNSAIDGVLFHLRNPDAKPSESHENWLAFKESEGWIYGPIKDADKKEHPCMVPYEELPQEQRSKDYIFRGLCHALFAMSNEEE